jgi:hypothetical protein
MLRFWPLQKYWQGKHCYMKFSESSSSPIRNPSTSAIGKVLAAMGYGGLMFFIGYIVYPATVTPSHAQQSAFVPVQTAKGVSSFQWVDKACRMWAPDGDIDVDQTCLVAQTVGGHFVVVPNRLNDVWTNEIANKKTADDKWLQRFFSAKK